MYNSLIMTIVDVDSGGVIARDPLGGTHKIDKRSGVAGKEIKRGDTWTTKQLGFGIYALDERIETGQTQTTKYSMLVNASDIAGLEKQFVDDMASLGIDSVYLVVASDGIEYCGLENAEEYGLVPGRNIASNVYSRLVSNNINVMMLISFTTWNGSPLSERFCQQFIDGEFSKLLSPVKAKTALVEICDSIRGMFPKSMGVGFSDAMIDGPNSDASPAVVELFRSRTGIADAPSSYIGLLTGSSKSFIAWRSFKESVIAELCRDTSANIAICNNGVISDYSGDQIISYGVGENSADIANGAVFACTITPRVSSSKYISTGSVMFRVARLKCISGPSHIVGIPLDKSVADVISVVNKMAIPAIMLDNYSMYKNMSIDSRDIISSAIMSGRINRVNSRDTIGICIDGLSIANSGYPRLESIERIVGDISTRLGVNVTVFGTDEIPSNTNLIAILVMDAMSLTVEQVERLASIASTGSCSVVFVGRCGYNNSIENEVAKIFGASHIGYYDLPIESLIDISVSSAADIWVAGGNYGSYQNGSFSGESGLGVAHIIGADSILDSTVISTESISPAIIESNGNYLVGFTIDPMTVLETLVVDLITEAVSR